MRKLLLILVALSVALAFGSFAWAGANLCKKKGVAKNTYPITMNMVVKLKLHASNEQGYLYCSSQKPCKGSYKVKWTTDCNKNGTETGTLEWGKPKTLYMPMCSKGGEVTVWATDGCIEVEYTSSRGY